MGRRYQAQQCSIERIDGPTERFIDKGFSTEFQMFKYYRCGES